MSSEPMTALDSIAVDETIAPGSFAELSEAISDAGKSATAVYPLGGCSALHLGLPGTVPGIGISLAQLNRVVDYPSRDMTVTVEAGITLAELATILASEGQRLPVDVPLAQSATVGGVMATNRSGPRRFANGTMRDYVLGVMAIDGRGTVFNAGGRVVKNVAGYDFCKLLTGSMGTLAVISQVTLKVRPIPECSRFVVASARNWDAAEQLLSELNLSRVSPSSIDLVCGAAATNQSAIGPVPEGCIAHLLVGLEGTQLDVDWMASSLLDTWTREAELKAWMIQDESVQRVWHSLSEFPTRGLAETGAATECPLTVKINVAPSATVDICRMLLEHDPQSEIVAHAGNGIVKARVQQFEAAQVSKVLIGVWQPRAVSHGGNVVVVQHQLGDLSRQAVWGSPRADWPIMSQLKLTFDPHGILNPGRFIFPA